MAKHQLNDVWSVAIEHKFVDKDGKEHIETQRYEGIREAFVENKKEVVAECNTKDGQVMRPLTKTYKHIWFTYSGVSYFIDGEHE